MTGPVYRAGWPSLVVPPRRAGRWWVWAGPYVVGWGWDPPPPDDTRIKVRAAIEAAIEQWRDDTDPSIGPLYDPDTVKGLARAVRDHLESCGMLAGPGRDPEP